MARRVDVLVIGGGHAGVEAAAAAARLGCETLLLSPDLHRLGQMSCNPAMGGVAKGVVVREIDAMGGVMGEATDASRLHFRMLNRSKGPAVWGPRGQCDRSLYPRVVRGILEAQPHLSLVEGTVEGLVVEGGRVVGARLADGEEIEAGACVVTAGTFLRGRIHRGLGPGESGGRAGEAAVISLAESLEGLGLVIGRFKTGTPPRIDGESVDYTVLERQDGEEPGYRFSYWADAEPAGELPCWLTWTGSEGHSIVSRHLAESSLYGGEISGRGPRYCPSIEDKIVRFAGVERHKVFLEPEGLDTTELYVNGLSTSLPLEVQVALLRSVRGLEEVEVTRAGYAIEYDYFPPEQLRSTLEVRAVPGLWLAGQINGTTGYEEAGGQGLVAGINAALFVQGRDPWVPTRESSFLGVLVDDLVSKGVDEPYRLFTSRAEFRLLLRQDNAPERLSAKAIELGLLQSSAVERLSARGVERRYWKGWLQEARALPEKANPVLASAGSSEIPHSLPALELARRPELSSELLLQAVGCDGEEGKDALDSVLVEVRYEGYVRRESAKASRLSAGRALVIPRDFDFRSCLGLSREGVEQLVRYQPQTLGEAGSVSGLRPSDLQILGEWLRREQE